MSKRKRAKRHIPREVLEALFERAGGLCETCQQPPDFRGLAPHHIIFKSHGGTDDLENLLASCGKHHSAKHGIREVP